MCKHIAAALYGVGAWIDEQPQLIFVLRNVGENEINASAPDRLLRSKRWRQARLRWLMKAMSQPHSGRRWLNLSAFLGRIFTR
jgi:uncharacterized Zn finger protein